MASGSRHRLKAANSARFAEPVARVAPAPVSNGISFRALPRPSLDELRKICQVFKLFYFYCCRLLVDFGRDVVTVFVAIVRAAVPPSAL